MKLRIGTRRSRLALAQASEVARLLSEAGVESELFPMVTAGDRGAPAGASPAGVKGLFVAEIVRALLAGEVDLAVHSAKDLPAEDDERVVMAAVPARESPLDVLVTRDGSLAAGSVIGTSSLRRRAQLLWARPEVVVRDIRGNVDTRLAKLDAGEVDALVLAAAGLVRLEVVPANAEPLPLSEMVPAPGQGALAVQARADDVETRAAVAALDHAPSRATLEAERGLMLRLGGGCALPLGATATVENDGAVSMTAVVGSPDGGRLIRVTAWGAGPVEAAEAAEEELLAAGAAEILREVRGT